MNLNFNVFNNILDFNKAFSAILSFLNSRILSSDNAKNYIIIFKKYDIIEEYIIWGSWYRKLNFPSSSIILCIVSSLKNNAFIVKNKIKL